MSRADTALARAEAEMRQRQRDNVQRADHREIRIALDASGDLEQLCKALFDARLEIARADGEYVSHHIEADDQSGDGTLVITYEVD